MPLVAAPFREEAVLTLFERLTHFYSSLRALASLTLAVFFLGRRVFKKTRGGLFVLPYSSTAPPETALQPVI